ncbi:hypothetical protein ACFO3I_04060 [Rheinheimera marina]|uniref:Uncharacterized protein n=1 Tax=Rheinheimera marina TaxID=1774958 RepID=A0ABV9JHN6_9GAMM
MKELKNWWNSVPKNQKVGLVLLGAFIAAVVIMAFGVQIGASLGKAV